VQHREVALEAEETILSLIKAGKASDLNPGMATTLRSVIGADRAIDKGDPADAIAQCESAADASFKLDCSGVYMVDYETADHDIAEARRFASVIPPMDRDGKPDGDLDEARHILARAEENWSQEVVYLKAVDRVLADHPNLAWKRRTEG